MTYKFLDKYDYLTPLSITSVGSNLVSDSLNLRRKVVKKNAQRFDFTITVSGGRNQSLNGDLLTHWMKYGMDSGFEIEVPQPFYTNANFVSPLNAVTTVIPNTGVGAKAIEITSTLPFSIPAGRFIRFGSHTKLYMLTESVESEELIESYHTATINIEPGLVSISNAGTVLEINNVKAFVLNEADNAVITYDSGVIQSATLKFLEKL